MRDPEPSRIVIDQERRRREPEIGWRWSGATISGALDVVVPDPVLDGLLRERWLPAFLSDPDFYRSLETAASRRIAQAASSLRNPLVLLLKDFDALRDREEGWRRAP